MAHFLFIFLIFLSLLCGNGELQLQNNEDCRSGIYCKRREQNLTICPAGFFCPEGNITPVPCPPGTFRSEGAALISHSCLTCPVDFFNPMPGQKACLPCGSDAAQPAEGQETCICLGEGQVFQPRDAHCTCPPGYWSSLDDRRHCVRQMYDICRDSASRNQEGQCLTKKGWAHYCSEKVCTIPGDYEGYDKVLGLCICQADSLESVCDSQCRRQQRDILQFTCAEKNARLFITYRNGSKTAIFLEELRTVLLRLSFPPKDVCPSEQSNSSHPVYMVKTSGKGFLGVYNPDPQLFHNFIMLNEASSLHKNRPSSAMPPVKFGHEEARFSWVQSLRPSNSTSKIMFTGILNPTTCIDANVTIMFVVSKEHYPIYDVNNLYNTNAGFDWGDFRSLAEQVREASSNFLLFLFQFQHPGTYVLRLSSNQHKKMYVKVLPLGGQCYEEGPFFPTTPRYAVQVGMAKKQDLLLKPDWTAIIGLVMGLLIFLTTCLLLTLLCQRLSWSQKGTACPPFRRQQLKYNLDRYSSNVPTVFSIKKRRPWLQNEDSSDADSRGTSETGAFFLKRGDTWEPEEQIDLESFNTNVFFELLLRQSLSVTAKLGHFKEEVKTMYRKLTSEISSLKELWIMTLSVPEETEAYESTMIESYSKAKQQAEEEMQHRKQLAAEYEESVNKQMHLLHRDLKCQEEHYVMFNSALREAMRLVEILTNKVACRGNQTIWSQPDYPSLLAQIDTASSKMSNIIIKESHRLKAWGVLGEGMGAYLLNKAKTRILTKQELVDSNGTARAPDVVYMDPITGLLMPSPQCTMLLNSHCPGPVPINHFLHPETGKVLPVAGNIGYDPIRSKLVCAVDSASGELHKSEGPVFPYVPYPICPNTGLPVKTKLPALCPEKMFGLGGLMLDPVTEIEVPVLAITVHPHTGQKLSIGGTYLNPLTGTVTPLEIGGPMIEPEGGKIVPILGVSLDSNTGEVIPVGGLVGPSGNLMLLGDSFTEPLSGKTARVYGAHLEQDKVLPQAGSYQAMLEAGWLVSQTHVVNALKQYKESVLEDACLVADRRAALKASVEDMKKSFTVTFYHAMHCLQSLEKKQEIASSLKSNGSKLGVIKYPGTEMWIPAVFGMKIPDPSGSSLMVPVLGIDCDWNTRQPSPLAGTMEDADGKGLVPIAIGARTISPITGETGPVIGAQTNPWTHNVIPTVQSFGSLPRATDPDMLDLLEKEINSRQIYWHCRRKKEEALLKELNSLFLHVLDTAKKGKAQKIKYKEKVKDAKETCHFLEQSSLQEAERRTSIYCSSQLGTELSFLSKVDRDEKEQEIQVLLEIRRMLEKLIQFIKKMQLQEDQIQMQLTEKEKQRRRILNAETVTNMKLRKELSSHCQNINETYHIKSYGWIKAGIDLGDHEALLSQKAIHILCGAGSRCDLDRVILALASEFQECILKQQASVETAYTRLEYVRDLSTIQSQQAKVLFSGSRQCFENYETSRFYGIIGFSHGTGKVIHQKLIPLLKSVVHMLEENCKSSIPPETPGYSSRSTLKASATHSAAIRAAASQETASASTVSSILPTLHSPRISHIKQEIQTRFFLEKHACELAHLELSLMTEEINTICYFYETSKAKEKEDQKGNREMKSRKETEATSKDSLLKKLSEHHHHTEQTLCQKHLEEIKSSGLNQDLAAPKQSLHFLEEILHHLSICHPGLQISDSNTTEQEELHSSEAELSPNSLTQILQVSAVKIVKWEALRQVCLYRVLDLYNNLQRLTCPEDVTRILNSLDYESAGEVVAQEVAQTREKQQVARAVAFLQKHHQEGDLLIGLQEESEAELRNMKAQFRLELQTQTEEKMQAKEMQVIQKAEGQGLGNLVAYFILSQRHLRQTITTLQHYYRLQKTALRSQMEGTNLEQLILKELSTDDDTRDILHLLKDNTEYISLVLEYMQAAQLLQLRESHFKEVTRSLKVYIQEKSVEEANLIANELKKFREQKIRRLKDQLKVFLENKRAEKNTSSSFDPLQIKKATLKTEETNENRKDIWQTFQEKHLDLKEFPIWQISDERVKLPDRLECGELNGSMEHAGFDSTAHTEQCDKNLMKQYSETKASLGKDFHPGLEELRMRVEEGKERDTQQNISPLSSVTESSWVPGKHHEADDQLLLFLTENIKVLKQVGHLMASRIILLNPQFTTPPLYGDDKTMFIKTSLLLGLLKNINDELRSHAAAAGLLESPNLDKKTTSSFQDILDSLMTCDEELTVVHPETLSAREFVIYQYGISILQFLRLHIDAPEINLCVASSLPLSNATGNAFRNSFFYQNSENKLFILRDCLGSVGSFLLLLVHCFAHITATDFNEDSNPVFLRLFYQALKACLSEMFSLRLQMSAVLQGAKPSGINEMMLKEEPFSEEEINLISQLFEVKVKSLTEMETFEEKNRNLVLHMKLEEPLSDRWSVKRKYFLHALNSYEKSSFRQRTCLEEESCTCFSPSELEDKVDVLTEELVNLVEDEHHFLNSIGNEGLLFDHLESIGLERDRLIKQIEALEEKIAQGGKF